MGRPDYRDVEGRLYALGRPPEVSGARPHPSNSRPSTGTQQAQGTPPREAIPRLDLTLAVRQLPAEDQAVIREHYIVGARRHRGQDRARAVRHLLALLDDD